jgi:ketosteroid isomerase-like protein
VSAEQNIKAARAGYEAFQRGDIPGVMAQLDEAIEWITPEMAGMPGSGTKKGHAGVAEFFQAVNDCWEFQAFEPRIHRQRRFVSGAGILSREGAPDGQGGGIRLGHGLAVPRRKVHSFPGVHRYRHAESGFNRAGSRGVSHSSLMGALIDLLRPSAIPVLMVPSLTVESGCQLGFVKAGAVTFQTVCGGLTMSKQRNVQLVSSIYEAFGRGDIPAILNCLDPEAELVFEAPAAIPWGGNRRGPAGWSSFFQTLGQNLEDVTFSEAMKPLPRRTIA